MPWPSDCCSGWLGSTFALLWMMCIPVIFARSSRIIRIQFDYVSIRIPNEYG